MLGGASLQRGITLVELMVAGAIGLLTISVVLSVYTASVRHASAQLGSAHLHHQLNSLLHLMSTDIRRAGFWQFDPATLAISDNPFSKPGNKIQVGRLDNQARHSCLLFSYDLDKDGQVGVGTCPQSDCPGVTDSDNVEQFGFRLRGTTVQSRYGGKRFSCGSGYWQSLTTDDVEVTNLTFLLLENCINLLQPEEPCDETAPKLRQHAVAIQLAGQLARHPGSSVQMERWVIVRNHIAENGS